MWDKLSGIIKQLSIFIRIVLKDGSETGRSEWLTFPSDGYGELKHYGTFSLKDVKYIELNPVEIKKTGRLIPDKKIDHSNELVSLLRESGLSHEKVDDIFRIIL